MGKITVLLFIFSTITGCAALPTNFDRPHSTAFDRPVETALGRLFAPAIEQNRPESGFLVVDTGEEAFSQRAMLADAAERSIDAQYYIWNSDTMGKLMAERMLRAAERGVRVRVLLDDLSVGDRDPQLLALNAHPNIEVRVFNPFTEEARFGLQKWLVFLFDFGRLNRRMHNKIYVVDGVAAIVGGRNIGDEYFDASEKLNFRDRDLLAVGPVVEQVSESFDAYWNHHWAYPIDVVSNRRPQPDALETAHADLLAFGAQPPALPYPHPPRDIATIRRRLSGLREDLIWANAELVYDWPLKLDTDFQLTPEDRVAWRLGQLVESSRDEILIESAYFVPGDLLLSTMGERHSQGITWRALTNSLASNDVLLNHAGYARRRKAIIEQGVELYELRPDAASCYSLVNRQLCAAGAVFGLHSKSAVFDRSIVFVGSFNVNLRSAFLNSETILIVHSPELARQIAASIEENLKPENSWRVTLGADGRLQWGFSIDGFKDETNREPRTGFWTRFKSSFIALFPFEQYY